MFFRNLQLYRLADFIMSATHFADQLSRAVFVTCPSSEPKSRGWVPPRGKNEALVEAIGGHWLFCLQVEEKILPSSVINRKANERADEIETEQGYRPGRKQMRELRERVAEELMAQAFTRIRRTHVWIDPIQGWLGIDAPSTAKAEEVIEHLRLSLDDFPLQLLHTHLSPTSAMADWLAAGEAPFGFTIDREAEMKAVGEEKATVKYQRCPLDGTDIKDHLANGKLPTKLQLTWNDRITFVLTEKLEIKRMFFLDVEQAQQESEEELFDADFAIMTGELSRFIPDLVQALGGEAADE